MEAFLKEIGGSGGGSKDGGLQGLKMPPSGSMGSAAAGGMDEAALEKMLEGMEGMEGLKGMDKKEMLGHASRLWKHMDELAASDPKAYQDFLSSQAKAAGMPEPGTAEAAQQRPEQPPRNPGLVVNARFQVAPRKRPPPAPGTPVVTLSKPGPMVHAVVAVWRAVPAGPRAPPPKAAFGPEGPIAEGSPPSDWRGVEVPCRMRLEPFEQRTEGGKSAIVYEVACNKATVALACGTGPVAEQFRPVMVELIFRWIEKQHDVVLLRTGRQMRILEKEADREAETKAAAAASAGIPASLFDQLSGLGKTDKQAQQQKIGVTQGGIGLSASGAAPEAVKQKKPLVQEVDQPPPSHLERRSGSHKPPLEYKVSQQDTQDQVSVVVTAPEGLKGSDFDMDFSTCNKKLLIAETSQSSRTVIPLPRKVNPDQVSAKFEKRNRRLVISIAKAAQ